MVYYFSLPKIFVKTDNLVIFFGVCFCYFYSVSEKPAIYKCEGM